MTFSIVARDAATGDLGIAVASKFLAVGAVVPHARAGVGAIATQALANVRYGADGLALMAEGLSAEDALRRLAEQDEGGAHRQAGFVDANGGSFSYTGGQCLAWAGGRTGDGVAVQGNILTGADVVDAMIETYLARDLPFPELLLAALRAGDQRGGDRRGRQSAALLVVREGGGYGGATDRWIDLRVDDHAAPVDELSRLLDINHLLMDRPAAEDLLPIDEPLAAEIQALLTRAGYTPESVSRGGGIAELLEGAVTRTGEPRDAPESWTIGWEAALSEWMGVENLEERTTATGWIDPRVLAFLRERAGSRDVS
jgi:uncharacterized Ntn-hydrolase superfamily protein